jgi:antitoxin component of MazEF toxin-antitoxin module
MARRKLEDKNIRKLLKNSGGSVQVTLPIEFIRDLKWRNRQKVVIEKSGSKLIISDWKK